MPISGHQFFSKIQLFFAFFLVTNVLYSQSNDDCFMCHEDPELTGTIEGKTVSVYVPKDALDLSPHKDFSCVDCHSDINPDDLPHAESLEPVQCGMCHDDKLDEFERSIHGKSLRAKNPNAPSCADCHGKHSILTSSNTLAKTNKANIPFLCGSCHREGEKAKRNNTHLPIDILKNFSQEIHGKGIINKGLTVSATCTSCHGSHLILPHIYSASSISEKNIKQTCSQCHSKIEDLHQNIINKELWKNNPGAIPACYDCHLPHKSKGKNHNTSVSDKSCLNCHGKPVFKTEKGQQISLEVKHNELLNSVHKRISCVNCHSGVNPGKKRPCESVSTVSCSNCHIEETQIFELSGHGQALKNGNTNAPGCKSCHGSHNILSKSNENSPIYRASIPELCAKCHTEKNKNVLNEAHLKELNAYFDYSKSAHGIGLKEKGLINSAVCIDCHTAHDMRKQSDKQSSIHRNNVSKTCAKCHKGIYDKYIKSEHSILQKGNKEYPTCATCHKPHLVSDVHENKFMNEITVQCGECHKKLSETFLETYHGKVYQLGELDAARCSDCHGSHEIFKSENPKSLINKNNIVATCKKCHEGSNKQFTKYLTHATYNDKDAYPWLYYSFWAMTGLLLAVFGIFGLHTLLWFPRSLATAIAKRKNRIKIKKSGNYVQRFTRNQRYTHIFVIVSFLLLALTGMILKFAYMEWSKFLVSLLGGAHVAGVIHRFAAVITFGYFIYHLYSLVIIKRKEKISFKSFVFGENSLMFNKNDLVELWASVKWFVGRGPRPKYGRWTYWEKFDYFAVFWGVVIIGSSGLVLWFPTVFTHILPGWAINVALIIHSDEALLAVGFIFTIHFFNTHLRPEAFPMDTVIFTGHIPLEHFKEERPKEFEELKNKDKLKDKIVKKEFSVKRMRTIKFFGFSFVIFGIILIALIIFSLLTH